MHGSPRALTPQPSRRLRRCSKHWQDNAVGTTLRVTLRPTLAHHTIVAPYAPAHRLPAPPWPLLSGHDRDAIVHQALVGRVRGDEPPADHPGIGPGELLGRIW